MTVSVAAQAAALGLCLALGTGVGLFYDLLRRLRLSLPWQGLQGALDLLFWLGACGALFFLRDRLGGRAHPAVHGPVPGGGGCGLLPPLEPPGPPRAGWGRLVFGAGRQAPLGTVPGVVPRPRGSVYKSFPPGAKKREKMLSFFPVVE